MTLVFATNNQHKIEEVRSVLPPSLNIITLREAGIDIDIPEPHDTLEANAREKAATIAKMCGANCFSEDTGLEVTALDGEPGVRSARYSGDGRSPADNIVKLLGRLEGRNNRSARFRTVICLLLDGSEHLFEGICPGRIADAADGADGFGYDPIFIPDGSSTTFARMSLAEKNSYSHRRKAMDKLVAFLNTLPLKRES
ncbi:MAG: deoxyribonucleotide triphosphate pyrophosphatase [Flaviaesturariibacter sp.]|nr:deoxyribonucleotide triphosphate pyrophosphatase [Flaviaesturariibacter sp.]